MASFNLSWMQKHSSRDVFHPLYEVFEIPVCFALAAHLSRHRPRLRPRGPWGLLAAGWDSTGLGLSSLQVTWGSGWRRGASSKL